MIWSQVAHTCTWNRLVCVCLFSCWSYPEILLDQQIVASCRCFKLPGIMTSATTPQTPSLNCWRSPLPKVHCQCRSIHCFGRCRWISRDCMRIAVLDFNGQVESPRFVFFSPSCWSWFMIIIMHNMHICISLSSPFGSASKWFQISIHKKKFHQNSMMQYDACVRQTGQANTSQVKWILEEWWKLPPYWVLYNQLLPPWWHRWVAWRKWNTQGLSMFMGKHFDCSTSGIISIEHASTLHGQVEAYL